LLTKHARACGRQAPARFRRRIVQQYRADVVGSLLRPPALLEARRRRYAGGIGVAEFKAVEDRAVDEAVAVQERAGVDVVTDGEVRRNVFASQVVEACEGFEVVQGNTVDWFRMDGTVETSPVTVGLTGKLRRRQSLSVEELVYLRARTQRPKKVTLPSPSMYAYYWVAGVSDGAYASRDTYLEDVAEILRDEVADLVRLGCDYVQVDAPEFGMLIDPHQRAWFEAKGFDPDRLLWQGVELANEVIAGHPGVTFGLHVCRGNDANRYMASGGYEAVAATVFRGTKADRLLLEYDDERSGDFEPLKYAGDDKSVVLGLVSTKRPGLEDAAALRARIFEAQRFVPLDRLALSTQCGFASVAKGNDVTPEQQEAKLRRVVEVARSVWG
jgi:5-methyltetrahydropteroyltriglutamate--homocysteine methyltransferase